VWLENLIVIVQVKIVCVVQVSLAPLPESVGNSPGIDMDMIVIECYTSGIVPYFGVTSIYSCLVSEWPSATLDLDTIFWL